METQFTMNEQEMKFFASLLAQRVKIFREGGRVLFLSGDVGSGKTTFARCFAEELGIQNISSPTFSILETTPISLWKGVSTAMDFVHADFYRADIQRSEEIMAENIEEGRWAKIFLLEWFPEELVAEFFDDVPKIFIRFEHGDDSKTRKIFLRFENPWSCDVPTAEKILQEYKTPVHVKHHIQMVTKVATHVAQKLQQHNIPIDLQLVKVSALLHDGVRYVDFPSFTPHDFERYREEVTQEKIIFWKSLKEKFSRVHHAQAMAQILQEKKYFSTARVVNAHMTGQIYRDQPFSWEEICVYYADKRSLHDTFVSLSDRLTDGRKRYAHEKNPGLEKKLFDLEEKIFAIAGIDDENFL